MIEGSAHGSKLASKYLMDALSAGNSKQQISALDLQELKDALPTNPTGEPLNTSAFDSGDAQLGQD